MSVHLSRRSFFRLAALTTAEVLLFPSAVTATVASSSSSPLGAQASGTLVGAFEEVSATVEATGEHIMQWVLPEVWLERQFFHVAETATARTNTDLPSPDPPGLS